MAAAGRRQHCRAGSRRSSSACGGSRQAACPHRALRASGARASRSATASRAAVPTVRRVRRGHGRGREVVADLFDIRGGCVRVGLVGQQADERGLRALDLSASLSAPHLRTTPCPAAGPSNAIFTSRPDWSRNRYLGPRRTRTHAARSGRSQSGSRSDRGWSEPDRTSPADHPRAATIRPAARFHRATTARRSGCRAGCTRSASGHSSTGGRGANDRPLARRRPSSQRAAAAGARVLP